MGDTTQSAMTQETMTELVECNTQLHKTLQGLWSDALTQHRLQQHINPCKGKCNSVLIEKTMYPYGDF